MEFRGNKKIFLSFKDVIKTPDIAVLKALLNPDMKQNFSNVVDYTRFEFMNDDNLLRLCIQRTHKNILKYLSIDGVEFDYDKMYNLIYKNLEDKFTPYPCLRMVEVMALAISTSNISTLYIYSDEYDEEIENEIGVIFNANAGKVTYIHGDLYKSIQGKDIGLFVLADLEDVNKLNDLGLITNKEVLVANYGYNYTLDDNGNLVFKFDIQNNIKNRSFFKLRAFNPFELSEKHMSQLYNNVVENNNLSLG